MAHFINTYTFGSPSVEDMLASLGTVDATMPRRFGPWLVQAGFPVVLVSLDPSTGIVNITQVRTHTTFSMCTILFFFLFEFFLPFFVFQFDLFLF